MKRFLINTAFLILLAGEFSSCKKTIADDYLNPSTVTTADMSKLFSGMVLNPRIHPSYYDYATFILPTTGAFSQLSTVAPSNQMYVPSINYNESRWDHFYDGSMPTDGSTPDYNYAGPGIMSSYREMQTTYAALSATEQAKQYVFLQCAKVILYDQTAQMVDLWGDMPFSKANSLNTSRSIGYAPFDNAAAIYDTLITGLNDLNTYFASTTLSPEIGSTLKAQDILMGGDLTWWQRYANSLRLRLLMRISYFDEATAKAAVTTMLSDPGTYPLVTDNVHNVLLNESPPTLRSDLHDALTTLNGNPYAPAYLLNTLMVANSDPRTTVFWDSVAGKAYTGFPYNGTISQYQQTGVNATYDSATFIFNYNIPGVLFTAAEVSFLTAEANERWSAGSTPAATAYANGINQSVAFYYGINQSRIARTGYTAATLTPPSQSAIDAYVANVAYTGTTAQKLSLIATQNWINFFILQSGQAWAELRRTKYPALQFATANLAGATQPPSRLLYPASEKLYNPDNYAAVSGKDQSTTKIFWDVK